MSDIKRDTLATMVEMSKFLKSYGVYNFAKQFEHHHKVLLRNFSISNINKAISIFSETIGSFNDLIISKGNGHRVENEEDEENAFRLLKKHSNNVYTKLSQAKERL